ncbi:class I adenylate-forming enzyme family protein [Stackebrandtia nassauensis]|uniref:AMP-dependent synthetase and ligase n=1 Tax=Stackebrandtia nassauensis (strain DSM 44728 / CIP 108903 / NRRL B-16338 / NBRC 102104 / LLR-40K-21) TaxID=446470 RepID=D3Q2N4_STANL|nr:AMP-binding protein [Stackebrandtia nassauensis]ADD45785.1 AMP-dependent synthetase and ligase [Stackebrandtia nassauensis DSM 44728]
MDAITLFRRSARRFGSRTALEDENGSLSFAELGDRVERLAHGLLSLGLRPGDRVLDLQSNQNTYVETDLACMAAGLVRVALNYRLHDTDWQRIAADCGARGIIYDPKFGDRAKSLIDALDASLSLGEEYERLIAKAPNATLETGDLVSLNYTSGTTGNPKGVRRAHSNRLASLTNMTIDVLGGLPGPDDVYLHAGPITHTSGLFVLPFLAAGAKQLIRSSFDETEVRDLVRAGHVTHTALVPTMIVRLLSTTDDPALRELKMLAYAGAPLPPEKIRQAHELLTPNLVQYYGLVEAIPPVTVLDAEDHRLGVTDNPDLLSSVGRAGTLIELRVIDDDGRELPPGEIGEVVTRGPHVMAGYWSAGDTVKAVRDGWLHTGDLGRMDAQGRLWLVDRKGDMIITGGYNVYPREIETVLAEVPGVEDVAVFGVDDPEWGQRVTAAFTGTATVEDLDAHCRARLASYKKPKEIRKLDAFPLNSTGKIDKRALR